jgi:hypothetical protein
MKCCPYFSTKNILIVFKLLNAVNPKQIDIAKMQSMLIFISYYAVSTVCERESETEIYFKVRSDVL